MARPEARRPGSRLPIFLATAALAAVLVGVLFVRQPSDALADEPQEVVPVPKPGVATGDWKPGPAGGPPPIDARQRSPQTLEELAHNRPNEPYPMPPELQGVDLMKQSKEEAKSKSSACITCHQSVHDMHGKPTVNLGCTDCHGGMTDKEFPAPGTTRYCPASPPSKNPNAWRSSANPVRSYTLLNHESPDFIRFVNPGDLRIAHISCGTTNCHPREVLQNRKGMMTHGCMLWGAALYNNGSIPNKRSRYGEAYSMGGKPLRIQTVPPPSEWEMTHRGVVPFLDPLPRFENTQPGAVNILREFERGGKFRPEIGIPERKEDPGRPFLTRQSDRGLGTQNRTDPVFIGLQKTRLLDPTLNMIGTNDHPGDYRHSGCTACHVIYANDRSPVHSAHYSKYGNKGLSHSADPMIPKDESGHPIEHRFAKGNSIPSSQCIVCHMHPGTTVMNSYLGYMWWDLESDGDFMYPKAGKKPSAQQNVAGQMADPNDTALRGNWSDPQFLDTLWDRNSELKHNQFADFHGHGWVYRAVYKTDRKGHKLDYYGKKVEDTSVANLKKGVDLPAEIKEIYRQKTPEDRAKKEKEIADKRHGTAMHLLDIHMEKGMHCVDCHFVQDNHGNTRLQMEVRAAVEIQCIDCHGTVTKEATLKTSGPAAYTSNPNDPAAGRDLTTLRTPNGKPRLERRDGKIYQNSMVEKDLVWEVVQTKDTISKTSPHYNPKAALAKTVRFEGDKLVWGDVPKPTTAGIADSGCAHSNDNMSCITCHSSWNPSCYGCHLSQKANKKMPTLHYEGDVTRNYTSYNLQTLREEVFMLARDGNATKNRINPVRSACAIHVSSYNANREQIYVLHQSISGEGFSGQAFSTNVPHTVGGKGTTKLCTDCHLSKNDDNNALMAQLLMQGTGYLNFMARFAWVAAGEHGLFAVSVTENSEPQSVIGSTMHKNAYPEEYEKHLRRGEKLHDYREHPGKDISDNVLHPFRKTEVLSLQLRGEYLYAACGEGGLKVFDVSMMDHKGFAEKLFTAPASPAGQRFYVDTKYATAVASPSTTAPDPTRKHFPENDEVNKEKGKNGVHGMYAYLYVTDKYEGLITVGAATIIDGNPLNNFLKRGVTFNPDGVLCGAKAITIVGTYAYICCDKGVVVVSLADPTNPQVKAIIDHKYVKHPHAVACQFRYAFVGDEEGVKIFDITELDNPKAVSKIDVGDVHNIYVARTYAYLAAGKKGLVILDVENPLNPKVDQVFNADGCINDLHDVKLGITYVSEFAYLADGKNGMRVVQLTSPDTPGNVGFSPRPTPKLIATFPIPLNGHAHALSRGLDRDRAADESGNQLSVFGRVGARPLNLQEQQKMFLRNGKVWKVSDNPLDPIYTEKK